MHIIITNWSNNESHLFDYIQHFQNLNQIFVIIARAIRMAFLRKPGEDIEENDSIISSEKQHDHSLRQKIQ